MEASYTLEDIPADVLPTAYVPMIFSRWLRSLRFGNPWFRKIDAEHYYKHYHDHIEDILKQGDTVIRIAFLTIDRDVVLGFSVYSKSMMHYVFVQKDFRRLGIAHRLVPETIDRFNHLTHLGIELWQSKQPRYQAMKFHPFT